MQFPIFSTCRAWRSVAIPLATLLVGCADPLASVRSVTYPPDFHYITRSEIRSTMGALAVEVHALDRLLSQPEGPRRQDRAEVVAILSRMRPLANDLKKRDQSNHPRIDAHAPRLQRDIERALLAAKKDPPGYYHAGLVSGACSYCHARP